MEWREETAKKQNSGVAARPLGESFSGRRPSSFFGHADHVFFFFHLSDGSGGGSGGATKLRRAMGFA